MAGTNKIATNEWIKNNLFLGYSIPTGQENKCPTKSEISKNSQNLISFNGGENIQCMTQENLVIGVNTKKITYYLWNTSGSNTDLDRFIIKIGTTNIVSFDPDFKEGSHKYSGNWGINNNNNNNISFYFEKSNNYDSHVFYKDSITQGETSANLSGSSSGLYTPNNYSDGWWGVPAGWYYIGVIKNGSLSWSPDWKFNNWISKVGTFTFRIPD